ncbi:MAG: M48 family metalloprotease [Candidatus Micrarchaeota archaeon]|nr:M48 family metalloprotease [Candidatus Micrarchaeota archaeon]
MANIYSEISSNQWKSRVLFVLFFLIVGSLVFFVSYLFDFGEFAAVFALVLAVVMSFGSYYYSDSIVLKISGARPVRKEEFPHLYNAIEGIAIAAGIPTPRAYVIEDEALNAFATGRDPQHSAIAVTTGLLKRMNRVELEGVVGHEMSHIKNYDIRFATLAVVMVGMAAILGDLMLRYFWFAPRGGGGRKGGGAAILVVAGLLLAIIAPIAAQLVRLAISRKREYLADASGALITRYPEGLASALDKISKDNTRMRNVTDATAPLYIANPLKKSMVSNLFSTHPPIEDRIRLLRAM